MALAQTPMIFFPVIISRRTKAARIMVSTGVMVVMMAASAGEVNPHAHREGHLVENDAEQGGVKQGQPVLPCNGFPGHEGGGQPEQDGRSQQAEGSQGSGADFPRLHDQFADRRHEAPR